MPGLYRKWGAQVVGRPVGEGDIYLLLELSEGGWRLGYGVMCQGVQFLLGGWVAEDQEVLHGLLQVIHPEVGIPLERVLVLLNLLHGVDDQAGHLLSHLYEIGSVFQIYLKVWKEASRGECRLHS